MKVIVIGAGLLGTTTAYFLNRSGCEVTVIDRCSGPALETSFANGGMLTPSQGDPWNRPGFLGKMLSEFGSDHSPIRIAPRALPSLPAWGWAFLRNSTEARYRENLGKNVRLSAYSLDVQQRLGEALGLSYEQAFAGSLKIFRGGQDKAQTERIADWLGAAGIACTVMNTEETIAREPALAPIAGAITGGMYFPKDGRGDAYLFTRQLLEAACREGVVFRPGVPVRELVVENRRVAALAAEGETLHADCFVLAAGSYSPVIAKRTGIRLPIRPIKGYSLTVPVPGWSNRPDLPVLDDDLHLAVNCLGERLRMAGSAEYAGYDTTIDARRVARMKRFLLSIYPEVEPYLGSGNVEAWTGLRPYTCDGVPILGATPLCNLYLNTGHGHLGWSMAAGSGRLVADLVTGAAPELEPGPYSIARF